MRIDSWNVNGIRAVEKRGFVSWLRREGADAVCVQETKARPEQLPEALREITGTDGRPYESFWAQAVKPGYSGTAIYTRLPPREVHTLGEAAFDDEGRTLIAEFDAFSLICAYFPNSQEEGRRLDYKLAFCEAMMKLSLGLARKGRHFVLCGDYNIAHTPLDLARPAENEGSPGFLPEERAWMDAYTREGFADTFRRFHPGEGGQYTWWSYRSNSRPRNVGWRLDYHCVDPEFLPRVKSSSILSGVEGSDHCPVRLELEV
ncbi:MAG: exodeoxyribonuclease III [Treponematales bacterium]